MRKLETSIIINASAEQVWNTMMDFAAYPQWNPFITAISGSASEGGTLTVQLRMEDSGPQTFMPMVLKSEPAREFRWKGKLFVKGLFDGEHYFQLRPLGDGGTEFIHGEVFSGILVRPIMGLLGEKTARGFNAMNAALKKRVEEA